MRGFPRLTSIWSHIAQCLPPAPVQQDKGLATAADRACRKCIMQRAYMWMQIAMHRLISQSSYYKYTWETARMIALLHTDARMGKPSLSRECPAGVVCTLLEYGRKDPENFGLA